MTWLLVLYFFNSSTIYSVTTVHGDCLSRAQHIADTQDHDAVCIPLLPERAA